MLLTGAVLLKQCSVFSNSSCRPLQGPLYNVAARLPRDVGVQVTALHEQERKARQKVEDAGGFEKTDLDIKRLKQSRGVVAEFGAKCGLKGEEPEGIRDYAEVKEQKKNSLTDKISKLFGGDKEEGEATDLTSPMAVRLPVHPTREGKTPRKDFSL